MRIIAGKYKGKTLASFDYDNIRPTSDIVKEAVFNTLQNEISGSVFLDLFGGTGSVGLEALSRGACKVVICDNNKNSISVINKNNQMLGGQAQVIFADYAKALQKLSAEGVEFDLIFIDPPYKTMLAEDAIEAIYKLNLLKQGGLIIYEHHKDKAVNLPSFCQIVNTKKYGIKIIEYVECN